MDEFSEPTGIKEGAVVVVLASSSLRDQYRSKIDELGLVVLAKPGDNIIRINGENAMSIRDERIILVLQTNINPLVFRPSRNLNPIEILRQSISNSPPEFQPWRARVLFTMKALGLTLKE